MALLSPLRQGERNLVRMWVTRNHETSLRPNALEALLAPLFSKITDAWLSYIVFRPHNNSLMILGLNLAWFISIMVRIKSGFWKLLMNPKFNSPCVCEIDKRELVLGVHQSLENENHLFLIFDWWSMWAGGLRDSRRSWFPENELLVAGQKRLCVETSC